MLAGLNLLTMDHKHSSKTPYIHKRKKNPETNKTHIILIIVILVAVINKINQMKEIKSTQKNITNDYEMLITQKYHHLSRLHIAMKMKKNKSITSKPNFKKIAAISLFVKEIYQIFGKRTSRP